MASTIQLITLLNEDAELNAFPVEGSLSIVFTEEPDTEFIKDRVFVVRMDQESPTPNVGDVFIRAIGTQIKDTYDVLDYTYSLEETTLGHQLTIDPIEPMLPNSVYFFVVSKDLSPVHYDITKTTSLGGSTLTAELSGIGLGEDAVYEVEITETSQLSSGSHIIEYTLYKDAVPIDSNVELDIALTNTLELNDTISVEFNPNVPYLASERFEITLEAFTRLGDTLVQKVFTYIDSEVIQSNDEKSTKLQESDVIQFYETMGWARNIADPIPTGSGSTDVRSTLDAVFQYPNKFLITLDEEIDETTLVDDVFNINITYAFGNYLLPDMGLYNEDQKYVIKYGLENPTTIYLLVELDTDDEVPAEDKFILEKQ